MTKFFVITLFVISTTHAAFGSSFNNNSYLTTVLDLAIKKRLADERYWHLLLHYKPDVFGGFSSEVDDQQFFLAPNGKKNPQAELLATIKHLFSTKLVGTPPQPVQCAFAARYHWLQKRLTLVRKHLPVLSCERLDAWMTELNPEGISLIFPSAYMNNPASMFGHTFLRIDQRGQTEHTRILAYTINYAADVPSNPGIDYVFKGVFGGYKGVFSSPPYYLKVKEYRDIENRDIWEYRLNFDKEQVHKLLLHTWELGNVYLDYYFFKENCSYHILSLLEVADPTLHLTDQFFLWTVPADTIRLIAKQKGLVKDVVYRASQTTKITRKREHLSQEEGVWLERIINYPRAINEQTFQDLDLDRQVFVLDLASDYLRLKDVSEKQEGRKFRELNKQVLSARSRLRIPSPKFPVSPFTGSPELGHNTSRIGIGIGWREDEFFEEFNVRVGYHDLLDPDGGHAANAQIELLAATLRHYEKREQFRLDRFTLANVISLSPIDSLFSTPSWKFNIGMETIRLKNCKLCSSGNLNMGIGIATETQFLKREIYFAFVELDANVSGAFDDDHRIGGGITGGVLANLTDKWKILGSVSYLGYPVDDTSDDLRVSFGQRYTLSQNWALRAEFNHRYLDNEVVLKLHAFF